MFSKFSAHHFRAQKTILYLPLGIALWATFILLRALDGPSLKIILALTSFIPACFALLVAFFGIHFIIKTGQNAMASREALLQNFIKGSRALPWFLGSFVLFLSLAAAFIVAHETIWLFSHGLRGRGAGKLGILAILFFGYLIYLGGYSVWKVFQASRALFCPQPLSLMGQVVLEKDAPKLWALVRSLADKLKTDMPKTIIAGLDEGFFVTESALSLKSGEKIPPGRVLYLPLPYMRYMSIEEISAIIGHELGHFSGEDTQYSQRFAPIYASAIAHLRAVHEATGNKSDEGFVSSWAGKPALSLGEFFLDAFDEAVQYFRRERELAADAIGASLTSPSVFATALLRVCVLCPLVDQTLFEFWQKSGKLEGGFFARLDALVLAQGLADPKTHMEDEQSHPTDSHPTVAKRFDALAVIPSPSLLQTAGRKERSDALLALDMESSS